MCSVFLRAESCAETIWPELLSAARRMFCPSSNADPWDRKAASPGMWHCHLAVAIETDWLCDPTLGQVREPQRLPDGVSPSADMVK